MNSTTRAIAALIDIMSDPEAPLRRRIEATAGLLDYEATAEAVEVAKVFLTSIFEDREQHVDDRLDALKLMRRAESAKIVRRPVREVPRERVEHFRWMETMHRKAALIDAGVWPLPEGWDADLESADYVPVSGDEPEPEQDLAAALRNARAKRAKSS
jgi:hypothetical protein